MAHTRSCDSGGPGGRCARDASSRGGPNVVGHARWGGVSEWRKCASSARNRSHTTWASS
jgi:hypothetical protein